MEGEARRPPACVSKVLDDDNLLTEIIVRVGFPTSLVRAAGVCRRWLSHASDRALLRRFRELHPPRLLGFYIVEWGYPAAARFFPILPQPPELAAVVRRANFSEGLPFSKKEGDTMVGCSNGSVFTRRLNFTSRRNFDLDTYELVFTVHSPLRYEGGMAVLPGLHLRMPSLYSWAQLFSKEDGDGSSYFYVTVEALDTMVPTLNVYMLGNGDAAWHKHLTLASDLLWRPSSPKGVLVDNKIYVATYNAIVVLDLTSSTLSTIQLPHGVGFGLGATVLSRADDGSVLYLIHIKELQLHIWLHNGDNWLLVDTICLSEMCASFPEDELTSIRINHVGDYNEYVFLEMDQYALYLDVKCRTLRKVCEMTADEYSLGDIYPFMMSWPPIFPTLSPARDAT
ncbi:hypothetical protein CFC21_043891 [Triticum aestivum]|uniref:F-box protein AT5G49610-like beta-propeller domain-containing protein n=2 Tax=Triticum aestivum TaxID=4565 RepID=A0A9R1FRE1_WHEAT|nr:uncharacterized protein LOC123072232 [Triticum aestivum]KAF7032747.1 hypothetical protein CFC21_043891 [Triticum aestivum]